jgi:predicted anti-sigma-YlaC factor YlaD
MTTTTSSHPTEEMLFEYALNEGDLALPDHLERCTECSDYIEEVRTVARDIAAMEPAPVPERLSTAILAISRSRRPQNFIQTFLQTWYKNPFIIGLATVGAVLLLYALFSLQQ